MKLAGSSRIMWLVLGYNVVQFIMILVVPSENVSWPFVILITIPLLFASYHALTLNRVAYLLLLYWFAVQTTSFSLSDSWRLNVSYGLSFRFTFFQDSVGINPIAFLLLIVSLLEIDNVFPDSSGQIHHDAVMNDIHPVEGDASSENHGGTTAAKG